MGRQKPRLESPAHVAVLGLIGMGLAVAFLLASGAATRGMILHAMTMSVAAPLVVSGLVALGWSTRPLAPLFMATAVQGVLFFAWHTPAMMAAAMNEGLIALAMHASLFAAAIVFWMSIHHSARTHPWSAIAALIVSGKLFCLLSVVMVFAPRPAFHEPQHLSHSDLAAQLVDQQAAGMVMLAVCPLIYVAMAISLAAGWLDGETTTRNAASGGAPAR